MPLTGQVFTHVLSNPGAEFGDNTGWTTGEGGLGFVTNVLSTDGAGTNPWDGGWAFFGGSGYIAQRQTTFPTSDGLSADDIDNLRAAFTYRGRYRGLSGNNDFSIPKLDCYTSTGSFIGSLIGKHNTQTSSWDEFILEVILPPNTRQVDIVMNGERNTGAGANAYFDANSAYSTIVYSSSYVFSGVPVFDNPGAEVGSLGTSWIVVSGDFTATQSIASYTPIDGDWSFRPSSANFNYMHQVIDIQSLAINTACMLSGLMDICFSYKWRTFNNLDDVGRAQIRILDASSNELTSTHSAIMRNWPGGRGSNVRSEWSHCIERLNIPSNARLIDIILKNQKLSGITNHYSFDSMSLWTVTGSTEVPPSGASLRSFPSGIQIREFPTMAIREFPHD